MWPCVLTLKDVADPWAGILSGDFFSFIISEHSGEQVIFGIGGVIMMLDLRMNGSFGDNFLRTSEVVLAVDMLLRKSKSATSKLCIEYSANLRKRTLGIVFRGTLGWLMLLIFPNSTPL